MVCNRRAISNMYEFHKILHIGQQRQQQLLLFGSSEQVVNHTIAMPPQQVIQMAKGTTIEVFRHDSISSAARTVLPPDSDEDTLKKYIRGIQLAITGKQDNAWEFKWVYADPAKRDEADALRIVRNKREKSVVKVDRATNEVVGGPYASMIEAAEANGCTPSNVGKHVKGVVTGGSFTYRRN